VIRCGVTWYSSMNRRPARSDSRNRSNPSHCSTRTNSQLSVGVIRFGRPGLGPRPGLATAVLLPVLLWLIPRFLERLITF